MSDSLQEAQVQQLIRTLNSLTKELELLVDRTRPTDRRAVFIRGLRQRPDVEFSRHRAMDSPVRLVVGGRLYQVSWALLSRAVDTRLGRLAGAKCLAEALAFCDGYSAARNEFVFSQRDNNFADILEYYRSDSLHISDDCCVGSFLQDLGYWDIPEQSLETCCLKRLSEAKENIDWTSNTAAEEAESEIFPEGRLGMVQRVLWDLFEKPHSSGGARVVAVTSLVSILLSAVVLTLNTMPSFQDRKETIMGDFWIFAVIEMGYMFWFTLEFVIRVFSCPDKLKFFMKVMNWIDLLSIIPYMVTIIIYTAGWDEESEATDIPVENANDLRRVVQFLKLLRIVKTLRIIRIFKLARHSTGLQALGHTMKTNYQELGLLILFLGMGSIMFSSLAYVFENDNPRSNFRTMLDSYWWAIITMTTVGYGDVHPVSTMGKVIGTLCAVFGVLVIGLPIPIIGSSFNNFYAREKRREKIEQEKVRQEEGLSLKLGARETINIVAMW